MLGVTYTTGPVWIYIVIKTVCTNLHVAEIFGKYFIGHRSTPFELAVLNTFQLPVTAIESSTVLSHA